MVYKTSLDNLAKAVTTAISALFIAIISAQISYAKEEGLPVLVFTTIILAGIYFAVFLFRPVNYILTNDALIIRRPLASITIARNEIISVQHLEKEKLKWVIRTFGVGGFFGYWGKFFNASIGSMTWYATRRDKAVLITTIHNKKIILTPDEPGNFVSDFTKQTVLPAK